MKKNKIPKVEAPNKRKNNIPKPNFVGGNDSLVFSFSALEWTDYFSLSGTCQNWSYDLFNKMKEYSGYSVKEILGNKSSTMRCHNHENADIPCKLPDGVEKKDCYQIRIGRSKGGIHGVFYENIFYVIWLDPLHNMYPDKRYGGLRKIVPPETCCGDREELINDLENQIKELESKNNKLTEEIEAFEDLFNSK